MQDDGEDANGDEDLAHLAASAASGQSPPAGPEWRRGALALVHAELRLDKPLCASKDGFTLHAATRAGALDAEGREALLKYVLRPPIAQERVTHGPEGLVQITLERPFADGTVAVEGSIIAPVPAFGLGARDALQHNPLRRRARRQRQASTAHRAQAARAQGGPRCATRTRSDAPRATGRGPSF